MIRYLFHFFSSIDKLFVDRDVLTKSEIDLGLQLAILNFFNIFYICSLGYPDLFLCSFYINIQHIVIIFTLEQFLALILSYWLLYLMMIHPWCYLYIVNFLLEIYYVLIVSSLYIQYNVWNQLCSLYIVSYKVLQCFQTFSLFLLSTKLSGCSI